MEGESTFAAWVTGTVLTGAGLLTGVLGPIAPWWATAVAAVLSGLVLLLVTLKYGRRWIEAINRLDQWVNRKGVPAGDRLRRPQRRAIVASLVAGALFLISGVAAGVVGTFIIVGRGSTNVGPVLSGSQYRFNYPWAITVGGGHVWVANLSDPGLKHGGSVTELNASDGSSVEILSARTCNRCDFDHPRAITAVGSDVWVASGYNNRVTELNASNGNWIRTVSGGQYGFSGPSAIAVSSGHVWVANYNGNSVTELNANNGKWIRTLSSSQYGFNYPWAIAVGGGHVWVANLGDPGIKHGGSVTELNVGDGSWVQTLSATTCKRCEFNHPRGITVSGSDVWVASGYNNRVTELNASDGSVVRTLPRPHSNYAFYGPSAIAVSAGHVWVTSYNGNNVTELNANNGNWMRTLAGSRYAFDHPDAIAVSQGHIWVANRYGGTIVNLPTR